MQKEKTIIQVATGMFVEQFKWFSWYIFFTTLATMAVTFIISRVTDSYVFQASAFDANHIVVFVIGIMCAYVFLPFFIHHGITRRDYFFGAVLAAVAISVGITLIMGVVGLLDQWVASGFSSFGGFPEILSLFSSNPFTSIILYMLNISLYYTLGWFVGAEFYRFGWIVGIVVYCVFSVQIISVSEVFTTSVTGYDWIGNILSSVINISGIPDFVSIIGMICLILLISWFTRLTTKRVPIKL